MYEELEQLANLKLGKTIERLARENATRMSGIIRDHAKRGLSQSGLLEAAKLRSQLQMVKELCQEAHRIWLELILAVDKVLTEQSVAFIGGKVLEISINQAGNIRKNLNSGPSPATAAELGAQVDREMTGVVASVRRDLEILRREQALASSNNATNRLADSPPKKIETTISMAIAKAIKQPWTRDQKIALGIVILTAVAILVAISTPEIRTKLGLEKRPSATQEKPTLAKPSSMPDPQAPLLQKPEMKGLAKQGSAAKQEGNTTVKGHGNVAGNSVSGSGNVIGNNNQVTITSPKVPESHPIFSITNPSGSIINQGSAVNAPQTVNNLGPPPAKITTWEQKPAQWQEAGGLVSETQLTLTVDHSMEIPAFAVKCDRPCRIRDAVVFGVYNKVNYLTTNNPNISGAVFLSPRPLGAGVQVEYRVRAQDGSLPKILEVSMISPEQLK